VHSIRPRKRLASIKGERPAAPRAVPRAGETAGPGGARRGLSAGNRIAAPGGARNGVVDVDDAWPDVLGEPDSRPPVSTSPRNLAYAILTSGSTGEPKVVGIEHRNVANLLDYATRELLDEEDLKVVPFLDSIGFDSSVQQIFATLAHGGTLLVRDLATLIRSPADVPITSVGTTPSLLAAWLDAGTLPESVRVIGLGGEVIPPKLVERLRRLGHVRKVLNHYGPTETTIYSTVAWLVDPRRPGAEAAGEAVERAGRNLGCPIQGTRVYLLAAALHPVAEGAEGEITIAGAGVGRGYLGAPERTAERFGPDPLADEPGERCYRTGDRGRLLPDGTLEFLGRLDGQLKIRGVRLDAEEVEAHLTACPGVREGAVFLQPGPAEGELLVAALVADPQVDLRRLRAFLGPRVPALLVPAGLVRVERLPLTPYGKEDRVALKDLGEPEWFRSPSPVPPRTDLERELAVVWKQLLGRDEVGIEDGFFDLGGDSLLWVRLQAEVRRALGVEVPSDWGPEPGTIADLAERLEASSGRHSSLAYPEPAIEAILRKELQCLAAWQGERTRPDALIVTHNASGARPGLFWCFQGFEELRELARSLGPDQPVHGLRSGYLVMEYTEENVKGLAMRYAGEIQALQPEGPLWLGGNCQGGTIAREAALRLREAGRVVSRLFLMEQGRFPPYDGPVALIFGQESHFNPFGRFPDPEGLFRSSYPAGYTVDLVPGAHGQFFGPRNVGRLASVLGKRLAGKS
jgi:amino acid adenylation domain-containing protein